ncbi:MAG: carboxypeptidase regulatory-like domain-containing protein [Planctomycetaceae bacterium]|nr:carboxypeptidase regulatory-like domain-containing protein [Planctomycetaceae bacterium]
MGKKAAMAAAVLAAILLWWTRPGGEGDPAPVIPAPPAILVSEGTDAARLQGVHVPPTPAVAGVEAPEGVPLASATGGAAASPFGFVPTTGGLHSGGVFGRLVDEERRPVAGASVTLLLGGRLLGSADSGGEGEFFLPPVPIEAEGATHFRYLLLAADGKGRAARAQAMVTMTTDPGEWSGEGAAVMLPHMSMGTLTLRKAFPVEVLVTAGGVPVGGALVAAEEPGGRAGTGEFPTDPEGRARLESIPGGDWILRARGSGLGTGRILARVPAGDAIRIPLALRPLEIEVRDAATESPVEGVRLLVSRPVPGAEEGAWRTDFPPLLSPPSDSAGRILIADAGEGPLRLFPVRAGKEEPEAGVDPVEVAAGEGRVRVPLAQGIRLRWTPAFGDRDPPPEGSRVEVALGNDAMDGILLLGYGEVREARVEGGSLLLDGVEDIGPFAVARAPDGALARLAPPGREADPPAARFFTPRKLSVSVRDEDGRHVPGLVALLTPQGASLAHPQELDGEGRITFRGLLPETVAVCVLARTQWGGAEAARVDLTAGDGSVEAVVGREFLLRIRVRTGGKPGLPGEYELRLLTPGPACRGEPHFEYAEEAEEAPAAGEIRIRVRPHAPGAAVKVALRAKGGAWREAEVRPPAAGGEAEAAIELPTE